MNNTNQLLLIKSPCPICGQEAENIVKHHWYELPDLKLYEREICQSCNMVLRTHRFYSSRFYREHKNNLHHILPPWDEQLKLIQTVLERKAQAELKCRAKLERKIQKAQKEAEREAPFPEPIEYRNYIVDSDICDDSDSIYYRVQIGFETLEQAKKCIDKWLDSGDISEDFWSVCNRPPDRVE